MTGSSSTSGPASRGSEAVSAFFTALGASPAALLMLDYDGTLAPFHTRRDAARPAPGIVALLERLRAETVTRIVLVSGRPTAEVGELLGLQPWPEIWGCHGWERRAADGRYEIGEAPAAMRRALAAMAMGLTARGLGRELEIKPLGLAVHWRGLAARRAARVRRAVHAAWREAGREAGIALAPFDGGLELRVPGRDKGTVVRALLAETEAGAAIAYLGDDLTDEDAFRELRGRGLGVLVTPRPRATAAALWLRPSEGVKEFLGRWAATAPPTAAASASPASAGVRPRRPSRPGGRGSGPPRRLVIASNRLPVVLARGHDGSWQCEPGSGGLVTALAPVLRNRGGRWIGWHGAVAEDGADLAGALDEANRASGFDLRPVTLDAQERLDYYQGFANESVWPLFHDIPSRCRFLPSYWSAYRGVCQRFAGVILRELREHDVLWVHDYHLMGVARELASGGRRGPLAFFLHIPFPPLDIFLKLPWRFEILEDLLHYDLVGFQTLRDRRNFLQCLRALRTDCRLEGKGAVLRLQVAGRRLLVGAFPIGIDARQFAAGAQTPDVAELARHVHAQFSGQQLLLGVDRLDYTKGVPEKLRALRAALRQRPDLRGRVVLTQVVVPSRSEIPEYSTLKAEIEQLVGEINGEFTRPGWTPVHYVYRALERRELLAYYRAAHALIATPWKDGMNLVAKEYCACQVDEGGVLILSEFAGAVAQLHRHALIVNPHDVEEVAGAIAAACDMPEDERRRRMRRLRLNVWRQDVFWWVNSFLEALVHERLDSFPSLEDYVPSADRERAG